MKSITFIFVFLFLCTCLTFSQDGSSESPDKTVQRLYDLVTFEAGTTPDWDEVRSLFIKEAVIVLRTSWDSCTVFTLEGFVGDFVNFIEQANVESTGFSEKILNMKTLEFGNMANILVLYEAYIPGSERPPGKGVDNFSLIKKKGRWWIISVTNELPTPDRPIPDVLQN
ncbi:MAG: hypothetical protein ISS19_03085 [Bacteroidales bacterium]|nr:hypothetical protein [Bacteroidales bacterium]